MSEMLFFSLAMYVEKFVLQQIRVFLNTVNSENKPLHVYKPLQI